MISVIGEGTDESKLELSRLIGDYIIHFNGEVDPIPIEELPDSKRNNDYLISEYKKAIEDNIPIEGDMNW